MALGAKPAAVQSLALRNAMSWAAGGVIAGLALSIVATRFFRALLFGISPTDPETHAAVVMLLTALILGPA